MYIGKVAKLTGATPKAIRYYEEIGLLSSPQRVGNYRYYSDSDVMLIKMIRRARLHGFKLSEIRLMLENAIVDGGVEHQGIISALAEKKTQVKNEIVELSLLEQRLAELIDSIRTHNRCPYEDKAIDSAP